jgi:predicted nuclease of predicted toxin-antitoxin system
MKFIVDVCLSRQVAQTLDQAGHEAIHWSEVGDPKAKDAVIMAWAAHQLYIVITADTDFGHLLAKSSDASPSTIILRTAVHSAHVVVPLLLQVIPASLTELDEGALITVDEQRVRIRRLPIG